MNYAGAWTTRIETCCDTASLSYPYYLSQIKVSNKLKRTGSNGILVLELLYFMQQAKEKCVDRIWYFSNYFISFKMNWNRTLLQETRKSHYVAEPDSCHNRVEDPAYPEFRIEIRLSGTAEATRKAKPYTSTHQPCKHPVKLLKHNIWPHRQSNFVSRNAFLTSL